MTSPGPREVNDFHTNSDVDSKHTAQHHTIGINYEQVAGGQHDHDSKNSRALLANTTLTGSKAGGAALVSVIAALVKLGAIDATSA